MFDNAANEIYFYNPAEKTVTGIWETYQDSDEGWYVDVYQLTEHGWESADGAMFTIERGKDGCIVEGYKSAMECYEDAYKRDGNVFCDEMVFNMASDLEYENREKKYHAGRGFETVE